MKLRLTAARTWRWLRSRGARNAAVLLYHRICDDTHDPFSLSVSPQHFEAHMRLLAARYRVVSLHTLAQELTERRITPGTVAVTFDDGYENNLRVAAPILERIGVPTTVFVTSGVRGEEYWWDTLVRLLFVPRSLPPALVVRGQTFEVPPDERSRPGARRLLLDRVHRLLQPLPLRDIHEALASLSTHVEEAPRAPMHRSCTVAELRELAARPDFEIGAHSLSHPVLSSLSDDAQLQEIAGSKESLETLLAKPVETFSYPYGQPGQYNTRSISHVRRAGFRVACTAGADTVRETTSSLQVPRLWIRDAGQEQFARLIWRWTGV
jgi:peptidoglycan/xylan/chitin deacetylase (PgdA/CDA1 family)